ncbi:outer membrane efflux protein [Pedobacter sp. BAL39]|uniref:TolC family protein n=1 Tax=Pedobacter sp. BAL39 TaxID=391596 RepID=UPI0001559202|nr:TolC family protein [Pedobacter sp. BAL39]EDM36105.1 outer membrane efflux protein [Pedobacter sp. BAL39]
MKTNLTIFCCLLLALWLPGDLKAQEPLDKYIAEAISNNLGLKQQDFALQKSLYALKEAKGLFLPEVEFNTSYVTSGGGRKIEIPIGDLLNPVYSTLNNLTNSSRFPQVKNVSQAFNPTNYYDAKLHTTMPLYNAEVIYNSRIKKEQISYQQAQLSVYKRELVKQVKLGYYGYQQSLQSLKILENGLLLANENLRINQSMVKNGKAIRTVVSRAENEVAGLQAQLGDAKATSLNAAAYFNFLLNRPLDAAIEADFQQPLVKDTTAGGQREELAAMASATQLNELSLRMTKSNMLPKLSTFLDLGSQGDFIKVNGETPYYLFGVTLSWNIFSGNRNNNKIQQAQLELRSAHTQLEQVEQQLQMEVLTAKNRLEAANQAFSAAQSQVSLSEQYFKDQQRLYKEGQALYLELLDAQTRLINDQQKQSIAYLNVQTRQTELERANASYQY